VRDPLKKGTMEVDIKRD